MPIVLLIGLGALAYWATRPFGPLSGWKSIPTGKWLSKGKDPITGLFVGSYQDVRGRRWIVTEIVGLTGTHDFVATLADNPTVRRANNANPSLAAASIDIDADTTK